MTGHLPFIKLHQYEILILLKMIKEDHLSKPEQ